MQLRTLVPRWISSSAHLQLSDAPGRVALRSDAVALRHAGRAPAPPFLYSPVHVSPTKRSGQHFPFRLGGMQVPFGASAMASVMNALSYAGPATHSSNAYTCVAMLKKATGWADRRLAKLTGLDEAADCVVNQPTYVVDRHTFASMVARIYDTSMPNESLMDVVTGARITHTLTMHATALWDPTTSSRVLLAPNVLERTYRYSLDQSQWCKWVNMHAGLYGVILSAAPFLWKPDGGLDVFIERLLLADALVDACMDTLTAKDLSSVEWLRSHGPRVSVRSLIDYVGVGESTDENQNTHVPDSPSRDGIEEFARFIIHGGHLPRLVEDEANVPSAHECANPDLWTMRVG